MSATKTLIVDNNIDLPWKLCPDFRRYLDGHVSVRRAPQQDLPSDPRAFSHIILTGSKTSILDSSPWVLKLMEFIRSASTANVPLLGVCYGHQIIARAFGGDVVVRRSDAPEFGWVEIEQTAENPILKGLPKKFHSFQFHFEEVCEAPKGFVATAGSPRCPIQAYYVEKKPIYGVQFHPERSGVEGEAVLIQKKKIIPQGCVFNPGKANSVFTENVARTIFKNFLEQERP